MTKPTAEDFKEETMNKTLAITAVLIAVFILGASSTQLTTRWMNDDVKEHGDWHFAQHVEKYGKHSTYMTHFAPFWFGTGVGTNRHPVELGFRSDGVVVWRKKQD